MKLYYIGVMALILVMGACATSGTGQLATDTAAGQKMSDQAVKADQSRITEAEIQSANLPNAYELVSRLRRPWLRRDPRTGGEVTVYMDEQNIGDAEKLREIPAVEVNELRYLSNEDAVRRWGPSVAGSVIVVIRRR